MYIGTDRQSIEPQPSARSPIMLGSEPDDTRESGLFLERCRASYVGPPTFDLEKGGLIVKTMKFVLAGAVLAGSLAVTVPASAQRLTFGPDGPGIDLRNRNQRMRDRELARRDREDSYYRQQRYRDRSRGYRRDYDY